MLKADIWSSQMTSEFCLQGVTHRYMETFSIGPVVVAQEVVGHTSSLATGEVTLIQSYFTVICDCICLHSMVHSTDVMLLPTLTLLRSESYRSHTPGSPGKYTD